MSKDKQMQDVTDYKQLIDSKWLRGYDLPDTHDTVLTVKSVTYDQAGSGIDGKLVVIAWEEEGWKPYGTLTDECLKAISAVYGTRNPNEWTPGQKLALHPVIQTSYGDTKPAVRFRSKAPLSIKAEQVATLQGLIDNTKTDIAAFCGWVGCDSLANFPASRYAEAVKMLARKESK